MSRVDVNFPTSGVNYEGGFGTIESNFWLGLSKIYDLTNPTANGGHTYRLRVEMYSADQAKWVSDFSKKLELTTSQLRVHVNRSSPLR